MEAIGQESVSMIMNHKPYRAMKESGIPWLEDVPEHWSIERLKSSVSNVIEPTTERRSSDLYVALEHVESWTGRLTPAGSDVVFDSQVKRFRQGDVLFGKLRPYLAKVTRPTSDGVCVGEFLVLRPHASHCYAPYLEQLLRSKPVIDAVSSSTFGAKMPRADWQFLGGMPITLPPLLEQAGIVRFLDYMGRRIRRYIRAKQKLTKLLEEQKRAIIHGAVTRGLDPDVRLKPSGVEWLGDVPEHWEVVPLKFLSEGIQNGATPPTSETAFYDNGTVPWYGPSSCVQEENVGKPVRHLAEAAFTAGRARLIHPPALLVVVIGATAGRTALLPNDGATNQQITSYKLRTKRVNARFVLHQIRSAEHWLRSTASTATIPILDGGTVSRLPVAIGSITEQESIVRHVDEETSDIAKAIERARREIGLLREYRTRLIADVVTGKLDVREAAARLPDETGESEPLEDPEDEAVTDDATGQLDAVPEETEV